MAEFWSSYQDLAAFRPERFNAVGLAGNQRAKALLACFEPGQFIPVHRPGVDVTLVVLEGRGQLVAGERETHIGPGAVAFIPAGEARGILAETRLVLLNVVTPPPTDADHAEVAVGLQRGVWR